MSDVFSSNDSPKVQQMRLERLVRSLDPDVTIEFETSNSMRFRLLRESKVIGSIREDEQLLTTEMADKSDADVRLIIENVKRRVLLQ